MTNIEPLVSIDLGQRNVETGYIDSIRAVADTILDPKYAATGDALSWATGVDNEVRSALLEPDSPVVLDLILIEGIEHLYQSTGLYAAADGISGMFFIAPEEFFSELGV